MRQLNALIIILFISSMGHTQYEDEPGFSTKIDSETLLGDFAIDVPKEKLANYLILKSEVLGDNFATSSYQVDFNKAGLTNYFGLPIKEMSVEFDGERTIEGELANEDVYSVTVLLKIPETDLERYTFMSAVEDYFGDAERMFDPDYLEVIRLFWWSEITMLTLNLGVEVETGEELDYFKVSFQQAYGG